MSALDIVTNAKLRHEFGRALSLVEQAQLTLFRETPPQRRVEIEDLDRMLGQLAPGDGVRPAAVEDALLPLGDDGAHYLAAHRSQRR